MHGSTLGAANPKATCDMWVGKPSILKGDWTGTPQTLKVNVTNPNLEPEMLAAASVWMLSMRFEVESEPRGLASGMIEICIECDTVKQVLCEVCEE